MVKKKKKGSTDMVEGEGQETSGGVGEQEGEDEAVDEELPPVDDDVYYQADLAEMLGVIPMVFPVQVCPDSQIPPDSMTEVPTSDDQVPDVPMAPHEPAPAQQPEPIPEPVQKPADAVEETQIESPELTPTEIETTPPTAKGGGGDVVDLSTPPSVGLAGCLAGEAGPSKSLDEVRLRIQALKSLEMNLVTL